MLSLTIMISSKSVFCPHKSDEITCNMLAVTRLISLFLYGFDDLHHYCTEIHKSKSCHVLSKSAGFQSMKREKLSDRSPSVDFTE